MKRKISEEKEIEIWRQVQEEEKKREERILKLKRKVRELLDEIEKLEGYKK